MDEALSLIRQNQANKETSQFRSKTDRFQLSSEPPLGSPPGIDLASLNLNKILEEQTKKQVNRDKTEYSKPFASTSPRFNYEKDQSRQNQLPAPGQYQIDYESKEIQKRQEIMKAGTIDKKYVPSLGVENRDKHSLFGKIVNDGKNSSSLGPGAYDISQNIDSNKKSFNATLLKKKEKSPPA